MNPAFSLYLDLARILAAGAVFIDHASTKVATGGLLWQVGPLGNDAVVVFFVLSGLVVAYAASERERSGRVFAVNRLARLYSGAVPALLIGLAVDQVGFFIDPTVYVLNVGLHATDRPWRILNCLLFTNQVWFQDIQPGTNIPYWSLGYEAPYYLAFGLAMFVPRRWGLLAAGAVMVAAGPNIAKLAPMWLLGVGAYAVMRRQREAVSGVWTVLLWMATILGLAIVLFPVRFRAYLYIPMEGSAAYLGDLGHYYAVAALFALNLVAAWAAAPHLARFIEPFSGLIRWFAARTFALYLFHQPLIQFMDAISPWPNTDWTTRTMVLGVVPVLVLGLAEISERRKHDWRRLFAWMLAPRVRAGL